MYQRLLLPVVLLLSVLNAVSQQSTFIIEAGNFDRVATPVSFRSAKSLPPGDYLLVNQQTKKQYNAQVLADSVVNFMLPEKLSAGSRATYRLQKGRLASVKKIDVSTTATGLSIMVNGRPVLFYHIKQAEPPADSPAYYQRSGFIHPLQTPSGKIITDDFPAGHAHQHGIMMAWASTSFKNTNIDFWNQQNKTGNVRHVKLLSIERGSALARIKLQLEHYSIQHGKALNETWTIICYPISNYYLFDIISEQENITTDSLMLKKYHYGGMEFRGSREWNEDDKKHFTNKWIVETDSGYDSGNANAKPAAYVNVYGRVSGKYCGTTVFSFPSNFRYPEPIRLHPVMPYWCFAPAVNQGFAIAPNAKLTSRYRYYVYDGRPDQQRIKAINNDIVNPPAILETP